MNMAGSVLVDTNVVDNDLWIAAVARQYDLPLATRDAHFAHVPGLKTLAW
jgi:predicted nucleic acid-binding protein